jgi:DNA gyrase subunit B
MKNGKEIICENISDFSKKFTDLYRNGLTIQRFKGLGEMNIEQLWETTMNAKVRQLLQVKIEDIEITENIFAVLMGDNVELRRAFIENSSYLMDEIDT